MDILSSREQVSDALDNLLCQVQSNIPALFIGGVLPLFKLPLVPVPRTDERDTVHSRHDSLVDGFSSDLSVQHHRVLNLLHGVLIHLLNPSSSNMASKGSMTRPCHDKCRRNRDGVQHSRRSRKQHRSDGLCRESW